jgi:hypothetical protein
MKMFLYRLDAFEPLGEAIVWKKIDQLCRGRFLSSLLLNPFNLV